MNRDHRGTEVVGGTQVGVQLPAQLERLCHSHFPRAQPFLTPILPREHRRHRVPGTATRQTWKYWESLAWKKHSPAHGRQPLSCSPSQPRL